MRVNSNEVIKSGLYRSFTQQDLWAVNANGPPTLDSLVDIFTEESLVDMVRRVSKLSVLVVLAVMATGCIVLPFGRGHGRHGGGDRHYAPTGERYSSGADASREQQHPRGR